MPLTLAIADGMIVAVGDQTLVIPLTHIVESLRPRPEEVRRLGGGKFMLNVRGQFLPVQHIGGKLGIEGAQTDTDQAVLIVGESETAGHSDRKSVVWGEGGSGLVDWSGCRIIKKK